MKCENMIKCRCTYTSCSRHGKCCECVEYHNSTGEFPGCFFSVNAEKTYDRSLKKLIEDRKNELD